MIRTLALALLGAALIVCGRTPPPQVGPAPDGGTLLPTWQILHPAGEAVTFHGRPIDLALSPDGKTLYIKDNRGLVVVDAVAWRLRQELKFPSGGGSMHGIAVSRDGSRVYATTAQNLLAEAVLQADGTLAWGRQITLPGPNGQGAAHPCGIALTADGRRACVCLSRNNSLAVVDLETGRRIAQIPVGVAPWDIVLAADGVTAFVTNWGGRRPGPGERRAKSSGTDVVADTRGIADSGSVSYVDLRQGRETAQIETGRHASDLELSADGRTLYVANANADTVSVLDVAARRVRATIPVRPDPTLPFGSAPDALALSRDGRTLYVADAGNNAVAVIDVAAPGPSRLLGFLPTGWYPGALVADAQNLYIANVKGLGSRGTPAKANAHNVYDYLGTVNRTALPTPDALRRFTAQVRADARIPPILRLREKAQRASRPVPVPARVGETSVFEHVVYVIKENRTYDQMFGDLKQGNGDPTLCLYGRKVTPNHHALAEQFVLLDNFYCNGTCSADGHSWATEGNVTDHLEKSFGGFTRSYTFGDDALTYSASGFLWDNVLAHGLSFRNYGEMDYTSETPDVNYTAIYREFLAGTHTIAYAHSIGIDTLRRYSCPDYPGWNMDIPDVMRADVFLRELRERARKNDFPNFVIVYLPNDHTTGTTPGNPTPNAYLADNDLALGRVVAGISRSRFWPKTCIFVVEDDPQDGFDHVDGHRSLALVVSPYTKRGAVVHRFYNQTSVLHTMLRILGLPALNQMDSASPLMRECFTAKPDFRPYTCLPVQTPLGQVTPKLSALRGRRRYWAGRSRTLRFDQPDAIDDDLLNRILWYAARGDAPYPKTAD